METEGMLKKSELNKMLSFSANPEKYATGSPKTKEKIQYLESIKHKYSEGQLAVHNESMNRYEAALKAYKTRNEECAKKLLIPVKIAEKAICANILSTLEEALSNRNSVEILYKGKRRTVDPYSLNEKYLVAYCHSANDIRTFRVDTIDDVRIVGKFNFDKPLQSAAQSKLVTAPTYRRYGGYRRR